MCIRDRYKVAIELLFALVKMNVEGEKGTFKPTCAAKTRHSTQRNLKFSGRVKPNIASGLRVTQLRDTILHSSFYQHVHVNGQLGPTAYPSPKQAAPMRMGFSGWLARDLKTLMITNLKMERRYHFILMQWLTKRKSNDRFASRHPQRRTKTGPFGLQVSQVKRI